MSDPWKAKRVIGNATLSGIYSITNTVNGKRYVGSAVNLRCRWNQHRSDLSLRRHKSPKLQAAWNKYGSVSFEFAVIELVENKALLITREQAWIDALGVVASGYNTRPVANSQLGLKHTDATRAKMTAIRRLRPGKPCSEETKKKIGDAQRGKPKPPCSPEYRLLMSSLMKGRSKPPRTEAQRANAAAIQTGKIPTLETRAKMTATQKMRWAKVKEAAHVI